MAIKITYFVHGTTTKAILKKLQIIPGVGKRVSEDFYNLGIRRVVDLKNKNPEALYAKLCKLEKMHIDRCMLYVMRCAVYYAKGGRDIEGLKWWNWKDTKITKR